MTRARWVTSKRWGPSDELHRPNLHRAPMPLPATATSDGQAGHRTVTARAGRPARPGHRRRGRPASPPPALSRRAGRRPVGGRRPAPRPARPRTRWRSDGHQGGAGRPAAGRHHQVEPADPGPAQAVEQVAAGGRRPEHQHRRAARRVGPATADPDRPEVAGRAGRAGPSRQAGATSTATSDQPGRPGPRPAPPARRSRRPPSAAAAAERQARRAELAERGRGAPAGHGRHPPQQGPRPGAGARAAGRRRPARPRTPAVRPHAMSDGGGRLGQQVGRQRGHRARPPDMATSTGTPPPGRPG